MSAPVCGRYRHLKAGSRIALVRAETFDKSREPGFVEFLRQRNRQQKADRSGAFGSEIGQIHAQDLARYAARRIVGKGITPAMIRHRS